MQPLLSICIPTYNRAKFLKLTIESLLPQLSDKVEIVVFDNASEDETAQYLESLSDKLQIMRQSKNIGGDFNMIDCLQGGRGRYIWMLCDDDLPYSNAVAEIISGIESNHYPPFLFVTVTSCDSLISQYNLISSKGGWSAYSRNGFLNRVACQCTFAPSIIAKRACLDMEFIKSQVGSYLVPAATTLSTVGIYNKACVSDYPLLFVRGENSGGYNTLKIFTKEYGTLLKKCKQFGYSHVALNRAYEDALRTVIFPAIVRGWKLDLVGLSNLFFFSFRYKYFYKVILRALAWRKLKNTSAFDSLQKIKRLITKRSAF